jgi:His-Xaa-Ser system protein HxsD
MADAGFFSKDAILKCVYWYSHKFRINLNSIENAHHEIRLVPLQVNNLAQVSLESWLVKIERDLLDFQLRSTISKETQNIRDLLVAKAFSNGELNEQPTGQVSDPIGFDPMI